MKPCTSHRPSVSLLACASLGEPEAAAVREHLRQCPACRDYFAQIAALGEAHISAAHALPVVTARPHVYRRIAGAVRRPAPAPGRGWWEILAGRRRQLGGAACLAVLFMVGIMLPNTLYQKPTSGPPARPTAANDRWETAAEFNLGSYRRALNRSPEALDQLLTSALDRGVQNGTAAFRLGSRLTDSDL